VKKNYVETYLLSFGEIIIGRHKKFQDLEYQ